MKRRRRDFIGLAAAVMGSQFLPFREGQAQAAKPPLRMLTIVDSYGLWIDRRSTNWIRSEVDDYPLQEADLGTVLKPLSAYIDNMLIPTGINLQSLRDTSSSPSHEHCGIHTLTGSHVFGGNTGAKSGTRPGPAARAANPSLDVRVGHFLNEEYGLSSRRVHPHLFLSDYASADAASPCFDLEGRQIRSIAGPNRMLNRLFGDVGTPSVLEEATTQGRLEVLDMVGEKVRGLRGELVGANASTMLDAYRSSVSDLATEIEIRSNLQCISPNAPEALPSQDGRLSEFAFDAIYQALACDMASSVTYNIGGERNNINKYGFLASRTDNVAAKGLLAVKLHTPSHKTNLQSHITHETVRTYQSELLANLLDRLSTTPDVDGVSTIFDNTLVFFPSAMSYNQHKIENHPFLIIAGKNTRLKGGMHYDCSGLTNNQLLATLAQGLTLPDTEVGGFDGTEKVPSLNAGGPIEKMLRSA